MVDDRRQRAEWSIRIRNARALRAVVIGALMVSAACSRPSGEGVRRVASIDWRFDAFRMGTERWALPAGVDGVIRFDAAGRFSGTACNDFGGEATIASNRIRFGTNVVWTKKACADPRSRVEAAVRDLLADGTVTWSRSGDAMTFKGHHTVAELHMPKDLFPTRDLIVLSSSAGPGPQWQFGYRIVDSDVSVIWEGRDHPGLAWETGGFTPTTEPFGAMGFSLDRREFIFGHVPAGAATARYEPPNGGPVDLTLHRLPTGGAVYGQLVDVDRGQIIALDAAGLELGRSRTIRE